MFSSLASSNKFRPVTTRRMRELDRSAVGDYGIPGAVLMENAGRAVAEAARSRPGGKVLIVCGGGNNGGDGLVAARYLAKHGQAVRLLLARPPGDYAGDARTHWKSVYAMKIPFVIFQSPQKLLQFTHWPDTVIDALLGTGAHGLLREPHRSLIHWMNRLGRRDGRRPSLVAVDVPSGLDADTGKVEDIAVKARTTITMGLPKRGLLKKEAGPWVGRLRVADIGFPKKLVQRYLLF